MIRLYDKPKNRRRFDPMTMRRLKHYERWDAIKFVWKTAEKLKHKTAI
jgi:hypothetical protein